MTKSNKTPAANTQYQLVLDQFKDTLYLAQNVQFPSITMPPIEIFPQNADLVLPAGRLLWEPLTVSFMVDDNYDNYTQLFDWMHRLIEKDAGHLEEMTTAIVLLYDRQYQAVKRVTFYDVMCTGLGGFVLTSVEDDSVLTCDATFEYSTFKIETI